MDTLRPGYDVMLCRPSTRGLCGVSGLGRWRRTKEGKVKYGGEVTVVKTMSQMSKEKVKNRSRETIQVHALLYNHQETVWVTARAGANGGGGTPPQYWKIFDFAQQNWKFFSAFYGFHGTFDQISMVSPPPILKIGRLPPQKLALRASPGDGRWHVEKDSRAIL